METLPSQILSQEKTQTNLDFQFLGCNQKKQMQQEFRTSPDQVTSTGARAAMSKDGML